MSNRQVRLSTRSAHAELTNNSAKSNVYFPFPTPILRMGDTYDLRAVFSGSYAWYNIAATDIFATSLGTVTFAAGNYTVTDIAERVDAVLNRPGFFVFERTTGSVTLSCATEAFELLCSDLSGRLGFLEPPHPEGTEPEVSSLEGPPGTHTIIADHPANIVRTHSVSIVSDLWTTSLDTLSHSGDMLLTAPLGAAPYEFFSISSVRPVSGRAVADVRGMRVRILDHDNQLLDFNNQDWELVLYINVITSQPFASFIPTLGDGDKENTDPDKPDKNADKLDKSDV
ncbi:MAG: hypothetical protein COB04_16210 [Gammaproteobacteria bacterium]|nr:MAG: hypothetical protein COB04_16210 [Gammaproteobacteria bacterium]